jgi:hypothetical protein
MNQLKNVNGTIMKISNRKKEPMYNFVVTILLMVLFLGIVVFFFKIPIPIIDFFGKSLYLISIPIFLILLFYLRGNQIFEYDSEGETLSFKNRNIILFLNNPISDEFPKYKLSDYQIVNAFFFKKLFITISSKKNHSLILKYDISYLTKKELRDLKFSLSKVVKQNRENKNITENKKL